ncbi:O-methyltransferase-domain-containing protein [Endogone sp. FLAS-F59071]|nr:O-methyltransferase-domain-containing protein [Endogone sp. FLAS-F59071]|eukprot:RUS20714.1 O-methyltransferase-domain-containing protein [Endogone sp. FLAS-F59071]
MANPQVIIDLINGFRRSKIMFAAARLGIFDILANTPKPQQGLSAVEIANQVPFPDRERVQKCSVDGLERLLRACVSIELLEVTSHAYDTTSTGHAGDPQLFILTPLARTYLTTTSPKTLTGYIAHSNDVLYKLWSNLESSVVTGHACWDESFGDLDNHTTTTATTPPVPSRDRIFDNIYHGPDGVRRFMRAMDSVARVSAPHVLAQLDSSWIRTLVDLGGSTGALAEAFVQANPQIGAIVVDMPQVTRLAEQMMHEEPESVVPADVKKRIHFQTANFFTEPDAVPSGNAYLLSRILHDWDDATCAELLRLLYGKLPGAEARGKGDRAGIIVCDMLLMPNHTGPWNAVAQDVNMLVQTNGRERSLEEIRGLLEGAGFVQVQGWRTEGMLDVVIGFKV